MIKFFLLIIIFVYWIGFFPGLRGANDFPYAFKESVAIGFNLPYVWSARGGDGFGQYVVATLWAYPIDFLYGLGATLGVEFWILQRVIGILPILVLGGLGIYKLLEYYKVTGWAKLAGAVFFLINTYILQLVDGGQLSIGLCYAWIPTCFLLWIRALDSDSRVTSIYAALSVVLLGFFDIRFIYILFLLLFIFFLYQFLFDVKGYRQVKRYLLKWLQLILLFGIFFLCLNLYWVLPLLLAKVSYLPSTYTRESQVNFLSFANIGNGLLVQTPHWYKNIFGLVENINVEFILIPILVLGGVMLNKRSRIVGFWLLTGLVGIFLVKGSNPPFGEVYGWLFSNVPGFSFFRDPTKFYVLVTLSYTVLIGFLVEQLLKIKMSVFINVKKYAVFFVIGYLVFLVRPAYLGQMTGLLSFPYLEKDYQELAQFLEDDKDFSRILWIPKKAPIGYSSQSHPSLEGINLINERPFAIGIKGSYETLNYLREASFSGQLLDVAGVGYIAYPPLDPKRNRISNDDIDYYFTFLNQLQNLPWIEKTITKSSIPLLKLKNHQEEIFKTNNFWWIIGSDDIYQQLTKNANLKLSDNALVFAEEYTGLSQRLNDFPNAKIFLNNKTMTDFAASFMGNEDLIFPASNLKLSPDDKSGWWKRETADLINWRDFLQTKYGIDNLDFDLGGGWAVAEGEKSLTVKDPKILNNNMLLARVMESSRSGEINFYQGERKVGRLNTFKSDSDPAQIRWFAVGSLISNELINIQTRGDLNVVNSLAIIDKDKWTSYQSEASKYEEKITNFGDGLMPVTNAKIEFSQINPTKYKVKVTSSSAPLTIVLSQKYDPLWKIANQSSIPVYSLFNGFLVKGDGEYIIEYDAQKYVYPGLIISVISLSIIMFLLFIRGIG